MTFESVLEELKKRIYHSIYYLQGEESYQIDLVSDYVEQQILSDAEKGFNLSVLYGKETNPIQIIEMARRYPMISNYQVVIVKEAQELKEMEKFEPYLDKPLSSTILVFCHKHGTLDGRKAITKKIKEKTKLLTAVRMNEKEIPDWVNQFLKMKGYSISSTACSLIAEYLGNDLSKIVNELDKLMLNIGEKTKITEDEIEKYIGISKEYNSFELNNALGKADASKAYRIIDYYGKNPKENPMPVVIGSLFYFFRNLYVYHSVKNKSEKEILSMRIGSPYYLKQASQHYSPVKTEKVLGLLQEYDLKSKGVGVNLSNIADGELLKELVYKIMN